MIEPVGQCSKCGTIVYCHDGFLNGIVLPDHQVLCFDCAGSSETKEESEDSA